MTEDASGSFLFESEDENCCSSEQIGDDKEERSERLEKENNDTEFISCLLGEQPGDEIGQAFRLSVLNTKNGIHLSRVLEKNINLACKDKLLSHETEIVIKTQKKCASSQNYDLTCHLPTNNCFLDHEKQLLVFRLGGSPLHSHSDRVIICLALRVPGTWYNKKLFG